jgi:hypothetical protein
MTELLVTHEGTTRFGAPVRAAVARTLPAATLVAFALAAAWRERGSIDAGDWLGYAVLAGLALAVVAASGGAFAPQRRVIGAAVALLGLAGLDALSLTWSASPALARDEALLTALYAVAFLVPALSLRGELDRVLATAAVTLGLGATALATGVELMRATHVDAVYAAGRLDFPISYPNGAAAFFLVGVWPAVALTAKRELPVVVRGLALASATALAGGWALAQSKGGAVGLAASTVVAFAVSRRRLRLAVPYALAAGLTAAAFFPLTEPYRRDGLAPVHHAGRAELALAAAGLVAGLVYALVDRRARLSERTTRIAGRAVLVAVVAAVGIGCAVFYAKVNDPREFVAARWESFKHLPVEDAGNSHFSSLGSNRYDFWRVALDEFRAHPVSGIGARGFRAAYLQHRKSPETPARAHSLLLDTLSETGLLGLALLALGLGLAVSAFARRARDDLVAVGALGGFACWLAHASVDWTWTFPAIGIPLFVLLGIASSRNDAPPLRRRFGLPLAAAAAALAIGGFGVPWLASRYVHSAIRARGDAGTALSRARRLDPLSVDPLLAEWTLSPTPRAGLAPLEEAVRMEPRSPDLLYALGRQQVLAGDKASARRTLRHALRLDPGDPAIVDQLRAAR